MINKYSIGAIAGVFLILIIIVIYSETKLLGEMESLEVFGVVEAIEEREKAMPYFKINGEWVYFGKKGYLLQDLVNSGDSLAKKRNNSELKLYKNAGNGYENYKVIELF